MLKQINKNLRTERDLKGHPVQPSPKLKNALVFFLIPSLAHSLPMVGSSLSHRKDPVCFYILFISVVVKDT